MDLTCHSHRTMAFNQAVILRKFNILKRICITGGNGRTLFLCSPVTELRHQNWHLIPYYLLKFSHLKAFLQKTTKERLFPLYSHWQHTKCSISQGYQDIQQSKMLLYMLAPIA